MFLLLALLEIGFPSNHEWAVVWVDSCAPLKGMSYLAPSQYDYGCSSIHEHVSRNLVKFGCDPWKYNY